MRKNNNSSDSKETKSEPWPGRYSVTANGVFKYEGKFYNTSMYITTSRTWEEDRVLMYDAGFEEPIYIEDYAYLSSQTDDTFSEREAEELVKFLNSLRGFQAVKWQTNKPRKDSRGVKFFLLPVNGLTMQALSRDDKCPLEFEVHAVIDLWDAKKISHGKVLLRDIRNTISISSAEKSEKRLDIELDLTKDIDHIKSVLMSTGNSKDIERLP